MTDPTDRGKKRTDLLKKIRRIMLAINQIDGIYYLVSKKTGLGENELALLYAIADGGLHSQKEISAHWLIPKTTVNTIIHKYKEEGLVFLESIEGRRREMNIRLTEKGQALCQEILEPIYDCETAALKKTLSLHGSAFIKAFDDFSSLLENEFIENMLTDEDEKFDGFIEK